MITRTQVRFNWQMAKQRLDQAKNEELKWRLLMADAYLPTDFKLGRNVIDDVVVTVRENISLKIKDSYQLNATIDAVRIQCPQDDNYLPSLIEWKPAFSEPTYNMLSDETKLLVAPLIEIKPGTPTVEIKKAGSK